MNYLFDLIAQKISDPEKTFIETDSGAKISYRQMLSASARYANALVAAGVEPGDRVAVQMEKSPAVLFIYLACLRAGAIFLPLNTAYTPHEVGYFLGDARPKVFVCDPAWAEAHAPAAKEAGALRSHPWRGHGGRVFRARQSERRNLRQCGARQR